jgi:hypothetical protein
VGGSHTAQFQPALAALAARHGWLLLTFFADGCDITAHAHSRTRACDDFLDAVYADLRRDPPHVLFVLATHRTADQREFAFRERHALYARTRGALAARGTRVVAFRDTPRANFHPPGCVRDKGPHAAECGPRPGAYFRDAEAAVARRNNATFIDLLDVICPQTAPPRPIAKRACPAVVGNVLVYRDSHHISKTYMLTLTDVIEERLRAVTPPLPLSWRE